VGSRPPRLSTLLAVGNWYTVGLCLGLGRALGIVVSGILGSNVIGVGAGAVVGAALGVAIGLLIGETEEAVACGVGVVIGSLSAAVAVRGALRRGATRFGVGAYLSAVGIVIALLALVPILGYLAAVGVPILAARMRGREAARFAGLRTLAK
jgi:hypothetical protein